MIEDQSDRSNTRGKPWNEAITRRDEIRRSKVLVLLKSGQLRTATDFYNAALIFQHGKSVDDFRLAYSLAWTAYTMRIDTEGVPRQEAAWLTAAAWDRMMIKEGKPQWYGTQYERDKVTNQPGNQYPIDKDAVSEEERRRFSPPTYHK